VAPYLLDVFSERECLTCGRVARDLLADLGYLVFEVSESSVDFGVDHDYGKGCKKVCGLSVKSWVGGRIFQVANTVLGLGRNLKGKSGL